MTGSILIAEDEASLRRLYRTLFEAEGYSVRTVRNGVEALAAIEAERPDLLIVDLMMPSLGGYAVCEKIRKTDKRLPILILSALDTDADHVRGLGLGADDYVHKAVSNAELLARVRRAMERVRDFGGEGVRSDEIMLAGVAVDMLNRRVSDGSGRSERLSGTEASILRMLVDRRGDCILNEDLVAGVWGKGTVVECGTLRVHVSRLKKKLQNAGELIVNERGMGYRLV